MKNLIIFLFLILTGLAIFTGSNEKPKIKEVTCKEFLMIDTTCQKW